MIPVLHFVSDLHTSLIHYVYVSVLRSSTVSFASEFIDVIAWCLLSGAGRCKDGHHTRVKLTYKLRQTTTNNWRPSQLPGKLQCSNYSITASF